MIQPGSDSAVPSSLRDAAASESSAEARLLVFTLGPESDARRHPLRAAAGPATETALRTTCLQGAIAAGHAAGCRVCVSSPRPLPALPGAEWIPQSEGSFGERLARADDDAGALGPLVIVGADSPGLDARHVVQALAVLERMPDAAVVGPAHDGGVYLIASRRPLGTLLRNVSWCGAGTRASLIAALREAGQRVVQLEPLEDLDRPADLERWLAQSRSRDPRLDALRRRLRLAQRQRARPWPRPPAPRPARRAARPLAARPPPGL